MKTLILVRHAKSSWEVAGQNDFDRTLNDRGKKDAREMAQRLKEKGLKPDLFVSSPDKRAHRTAKYFAQIFKTDKEDIVLIDRLYEAPLEAFQEVVGGLNKKHDIVLLVAHNPGITTFVNTLTDVHTDNMPTCGVFAVQTDAEDWKAFTDVTKKFLFFDYPKNPLEQLD
jgi:phosphohistidine phosphatase